MIERQGMNTLKVLSALLCYPDESWLQASGELIGILEEEAVLPPEKREAVQAFIRELASMDLMDAQSDYVETFDRGRSLSLLLFEHVHGESRDRGQAMVDLINVYAENGFEVTANELPDYLPLFLEYLSQRPEEEAVSWLGDVHHVLVLLQTRLEQRHNPYRTVFDVLLSLVEANVDLEAVRAKVAEEERDDTPAALDKVWEEEAVRFGADPQQGCPSNAPAREHAVSVASVKRYRRVS